MRANEELASNQRIGLMQRSFAVNLPSGFLAQTRLNRLRAERALTSSCCTMRLPESGFRGDVTVRL